MKIIELLPLKIFLFTLRTAIETPTEKQMQTAYIRKETIFQGIYSRSVEKKVFLGLRS